MTISIDQNAIESVLLLEIYWGDSVSPTFYADKAITVGGDVYAGKVLQANTITKTGQIGQSGVSQTTSVTLDDTDNSIKTLSLTTRFEGSRIIVSQYIIQGTPIKQQLMAGTISSDINWSEGERSLSFSVEGGSNRTGQSSEIGYAPVENAFVGLNPNAIGKNWPLVFGTCHKVPGVRISYIDELAFMDTVTYASTTVQIQNGDQLPQTPTVIRLTSDNIIFEGTMSGDIFTFTGKNLPKYSGITFAARIVSDEDYNNPCVAWVSPGVNLLKLLVYAHDTLYGYNYCTNQCVAQEGNKCTFSDPWFNGAITPDTNIDIVEVAKYDRTGWSTRYYSYVGDNLIITSAPDSWKVFKNAPVQYDSGEDYMDRYVVNLYPSYNVYAVYGRRSFNGVTIWEKIPTSYYHVHLSEAIVTSPGAVTRDVTCIDFPSPLKSYLCENWENDIWVTLESTLPNTPYEIVEWVTDNFTTFTFDEDSDDPAVSMNFAYFQSTDAIEFLKGLVFQAAATLKISGTDLMLVSLAKTPATDDVSILHNLTDAKIIAKTLVLGYRTKEEINTIHRAKYVVDYSGEKTSDKIYEVKQNTLEFGGQVKEDDMWALTCKTAVEAVTDFWCKKMGNSWKTARLDCFLDLSDASVFDFVSFNIAPFLSAGVRGLITSVTHDTESPKVSLEVELAVKDGETLEDTNYWVLDPATCTPDTDTSSDFTPEPEPGCADWSISVGTSPTRKMHVACVKWPSIVKRGLSFSVDLELHNEHHVLQAENVFFVGRIYTSSPLDCFILKPFQLTAGKITLSGIVLKKSMHLGHLHISLKPDDNLRVQGGNVKFERPTHL